MRANRMPSRPKLTQNITLNADFIVLCKLWTQAGVSARHAIYRAVAQ